MTVRTPNAIPEAKPSFPVLMATPRGTVLLFVDPKRAVCLKEGDASRWKLGELRSASLAGLQVYEGFVMLENDPCHMPS